MKSKHAVINQLIERRILELLEQNGEFKSMYHLQKALKMGWGVAFEHSKALFERGELNMQRNGMRWRISKNETDLGDTID